MNLFFRLIWILIRAKYKTNLHPLDRSVVRFRVWPHDLDLNRHMNNGRYLTIMDLGRLDLLARTGLVRLALANKWMPVVGFATVRFRRPLHPFQAYELHTWLAHWDDKWFYVRQEFRVNNQVYASAWLKGQLRGNAGPVIPHKAFKALGTDVLPPPLADTSVWHGITATTESTSHGDV